MSIQRKLTLLIGATSAFVLVSTGLVFMGHERMSYPQRLVNETIALGQVIGDNCRAPLVFADRDAADRILSTLAGNAAIVRATLLEPSGAVFANYGAQTPLHLRSGDLQTADQPAFQDGHVVVIRHLSLNGERIGELRLEATLAELESRFARYAMMSLGVLVCAMCVAWFLASLVQRTVSRPILRLTEAATAISADASYGIRVPESGRQDELGALTRAFNDMLAQIQGRDAALKTAQDELADRLAELEASIAERKKAEEALQEREEQLRQAQKMEAVGRLAGGVAHDFNNLLTAIRGYGELAHDAAGDNGEIREYLAEVLKAGERATLLTAQLLAFSRKQIISPKRLDLGEVVRGTHQMLRRLMSEDIELTVKAAPGLSLVMADVGQITQVLMNLCVNARDAMPDGGTLLIELSNRHIDQRYVERHGELKPGHYVMLAVTDTGTGMDEATRASIFEPFFTTKGVGEGTGLGLATVYGIVHQGGGHLSVYSEPNRGTTFKIYLPAAQGDVADALVEPAVREITGGQEIILLVEDEDQIRNLAVTALSSRGYTVLEAPDGETALDVSRHHAGTIDLVLTDVIMPRMNGREMVDRIIQERGALKTLFMSGYTETAIVRQGVLEPGVELLHKPFSIVDLVARVRDVLNSDAVPDTPHMVLSASRAPA